MLIGLISAALGLSRHDRIAYADRRARRCRRAPLITHIATVEPDKKRRRRRLRGRERAEQQLYRRRDLARFGR